MDKKQLLQEIRTYGDPQRSIADQRYHKSSREHWGVAATQSTQLAKRFAQGLQEAELLSRAETLWKSDLFDPMMCAVRMLTLPKVKPSRQLWGMLTNFLENVDGWALEDGLAHVAWKCILADEILLDQVEVWTVHPNFWMRRAALVYTLPFAKPGRNPERMLQWASTYVPDREWFIQKAIGWWLRVLGEHNPERVVGFLQVHWDGLKGVARKEATRKLSSELQQKVVMAVKK